MRRKVCCVLTLAVALFAHTAPGIAQTDSSAEITFWNSVKDSRNPAEITAYLRAARTSLASGAALPGPDTGGDYDDLAFALPANASAIYCKRKLPAATERLGEVARVWEAE